MMANVSVVLHNKRHLGLENRPIPPCGPNDALIKVGFVGLCGSDVHQWADGFIGEKRLTHPFVMGHEASGTVVELGRDVQNSHLKPGDGVVLEPGISCGKCNACKTGRYNLCKEIKFFSTLQPPSDGALCQWKAHPIDLCYRIPDFVSLKEGALVEPLSVAVHACSRAQIHPDSTVLICGAGPIGILSALVCTAMGITRLLITDISKKRLELVKEILPGSHPMDVSQLGLEQVSSILKDHGPPSAAIECTGVEASQSIAIRATKAGGTIVLVGLGRPEANVSVADITKKELIVRGVFRYSNCFPTAIDLIARRVIHLKSLITNEFPIADAEQALITALSGNCMKVLIECSSEQVD